MSAHEDRLKPVNKLTACSADLKEAMTADPSSKPANGGGHRISPKKALLISAFQVLIQSIAWAGSLANAPAQETAGTKEQAQAPKQPDYSKKTVPELIKNARGKLKDAKWDEALPMLNAALERDSKNVEALDNKGECYMYANHFALGFKTIDAVLKQNPKDAHALKIKADAAMYEKLFGSCKCKIQTVTRTMAAEIGTASELNNSGHPDKALTAINQHIDRYPDDWAGYMCRSGIYLGKGKLKPAMSDLDKTIQLNPAEKQAYIARARLWRAMGQPLKAAADYTMALKFDPHSPYFARHALEELYSFRGMAYMDGHEYDKAIADFTKLIATDPDEETYLRYRGDCYLATGQYHQAVHDYSATIDDDKENAGSTYWARAQAYEMLNMGDLAKLDRQRAQAAGFVPKAHAPLMVAPQPNK